MSSLDLSNFKYIEGGRNLPNGGFNRNYWMELHEIQGFREKFRNEGLYTTAYIYDSLDMKEANLYGDFYLDFDSEDDFEMARKDTLMVLFYLRQTWSFNIPESFIRIYFSGKKGFHIIVPARVFGAEPDKNLNGYYRTMAEKITSIVEKDNPASAIQKLDFKIYDKRRLFRLPNSQHVETKLYKIPISAEDLKKLSVEEIRERAKEPVAHHAWSPVYEIAQARKEYLQAIEDWQNRYERRFSGNSKFDGQPLTIDPQCIKELLAAGPSKGQRNNSAAALVSHFKRKGHTEQEVWDKMVEWNQESLEERELRSVVESVYNGDYVYGCSTLEKLATCEGSTCDLWPKRRG